jgi:hypothetical protein
MRGADAVGGTATAARGEAMPILAVAGRALSCCDDFGRAVMSVTARPGTIGPMLGLARLPLCPDRRLWLRAAGAAGCAWGSALMSGCAGTPRSADGADAADTPSVATPETLHTARPVEVASFSGAPADGRIPRGWYPYIARRDKGTTRYQTVEDAGRTVLQARASSSSTALFCPVDVDLAATPWLEFEWKVGRLDRRTNISVDELDDSASRVFVAFDGDSNRLSLRDLIFFEQVEFFTGRRLPYATLMYAWDPTLPVGTIAHYPRSGRIRYLVVESGPGHEGVWMPYRRDVRADYEHVFGEAPGRVLSVGVFTDSDDLKATVETLYGDLAFKNE